MNDKVISAKLNQIQGCLESGIAGKHWDMMKQALLNLKEVIDLLDKDPLSVISFTNPPRNFTDFRTPIKISLWKKTDEIVKVDVALEKVKTPDLLSVSSAVLADNLLNSWVVQREKGKENKRLAKIQMQTIKGSKTKDANL